MLPNSRLLRALCAAFLVCVISFSGFVSPAYADPQAKAVESVSFEDLKVGDINLADLPEDARAALAIAGATTAIGTATSGASITIATITTSAPGILGALGLGVTSTVALPVAGVVGGAALAGYGVYRGIEIFNQVSNQEASLEAPEE